MLGSYYISPVLGTVNILEGHVRGEPCEKARGREFQVYMQHFCQCAHPPPPGETLCLPMQLPARVATERASPLRRPPCRALLLALSVLSCAPRSSSAFLFNLPFAPHHEAILVVRGFYSRVTDNPISDGDHGPAKLVGFSGCSAERCSRAMNVGSRLRLATAAAPEESGSSAKTDKVYRADDVLVRESDIAACKPYDECDTSPETLGTAFGDKEASTGGGGGGRAGSGGRGGGGDGRNDPWDGVDRSRFHVHFGAGRLGLGLVVGAIAKSKTPYSIVQRPKQSWSDITSQGCGAEIEITVNGKPVASGVTVISEECDVDEYLTVARAALTVVGDRPTLLQVVRKATSFSCSLGAAMQIAMIPLLSELEDKPFEERPVLYACENDHDAVRRVGEMVTSKVTTIPCMVDRICTGRQIGARVVNVEAEPTFDGSLVLLEPPMDPKLVPFGGDHVCIPGTKEEANYFYKRKFSVVNGMHTVLGFMTLREKAPGAKELREHELLAYDTSSPEIQAELWAWVVVRSLALLTEFGIDMLKSAHGVETEKEVFDELLNYGRQALDRFSSIVDTTSRVLGGGLANRLTTRLQPMVAFMRKNPMTGTGLPGERFLEYAGVEGSFASKAVNSLAKSAVPFCTQEFIKAKELKIEERRAKAAQRTASRGSGSNREDEKGQKEEKKLGKKQAKGQQHQESKTEPEPEASVAQS